MTLLEQNACAETKGKAGLPRLDFGIEWAPRWAEFRSSLRAALTGPKPDGNEAISGGDDLRVEWVRGYRHGSPFLAALLGHAAAIWLITLPIWGFLPNLQSTATPLQIELTWDAPANLPPISLPARAKKSEARTQAEKTPQPVAAQSGADAYHPRQTIVSIPVRLTHPRQTLIEPDAAMKAPTIVQQLPNVVEWSAPQIQKPQITYATSKSAPELRNVQRRAMAAPQIAAAARDSQMPDLAPADDPRLAPPAPVPSMARITPRRTQGRLAIAAPQIADDATNARLLNIVSRTGAQTDEVHLAPPAPVPSDARVVARQRTARRAAVAPEIAANTNGNPADIRRLIAISAEPAPPAPEVRVPKGNLAANIAISPDGVKPGTPGGANSGAAAAKQATPANENGTSLPAAISVSRPTARASNGGPIVAQNITPHLDLSMRAMIPSAPASSRPMHAARKGPANVAALAPGADPEKLLEGEVFSMHVSTPNTTSTRGSWVLNFAQLGGNPDAGPAAQSRLSGPEPIYTVDPKYPPETMAEHIYGEVVLYAIIRTDGSVDSIQLVRGLDPRLDKAAMEALAQWKFRPGSRAGVPVNIEAVIHVPFEYRQLKY